MHDWGGYGHRGIFDGAKSGLSPTPMRKTLEESCAACVCPPAAMPAPGQAGAQCGA